MNKGSLIKYLIVLLIGAVTYADGIGCGQSSGGSQTYSVEARTTVLPGDINKGPFLKRVSKICNQAWVTIMDNWDIYTREQDPRLSDGQRFVEAVTNSLLAGIEFHIFDDIYELGGPRGGEREIEEMIGALQSAIERGQKHLAPTATIPQISELFARYNQLAGRYGLADCLVDEARLRKVVEPRS